MQPRPDSRIRDDVDRRCPARGVDLEPEDGGRPYFVMELVPGVPITEFCDREHVDTKGRPRLFVMVCHAVQHAHQKGIIHRDLKPSNVLVTLHDGVPVPKVIDFGIAKAIHRPLTEKTLFTELKVILGTPEYMAPEQAELSGLDVDTRADIYALGVLLYELLTGTQPFERLRTRGYLEMLRVIREEDPPKPSTRINSLGDRMMEIAQRHRVAPKIFGRLVRGDLDWISMKAMEKDRQRRYESAGALAADIGRYFDDEPVLAGPPGAAYRARKWLRRHRTAAVSAAMILLVLFGGLVAEESQRRRAARLGDEALRNLKVAEQRGQDLQRALAAESLARDDAVRLGDEARTALDEALRQSYVANIRAANMHREQGNVQAVTDRLEACAAELRGWEWRYLEARADVALHIWNHPGVDELALIDGGRRVISSTLARTFDRTVPAGRTLKVWVVRTGELLQELIDSEAATGSFAVSADGRRIASITRPPQQERVTALEAARAATLPGHLTVVPTLRNFVRIWEPETGREVCRLEPESPVRGVAMSADGRRAATYGDDHALRIWGTDDGIETAVLRGHGSRIASLAMSPDGRLVVSGGGYRDPSDHDYSVRLWDAETGETVLVLRGHQHSVDAAGISEDARRIVSGSSDGEVLLWDAESGELLARCAGHDGNVSGVALDADGSRACSVSEDGSLRVWSGTSGALVAVLRGHGGWVSAVAVSSDGATAVTGCGADGTVRLWEVSLMLYDPAPLTPGSSASDVGVTPDGRYLLAIADSGIQVLDSATGAVLCTMRGHELGVSDIALSADGQRMVSGGSDSINPVTGEHPTDRSLRV